MSGDVLVRIRAQFALGKIDNRSVGHLEVPPRSLSRMKGLDRQLRLRCFSFNT